MNKSLSEPVQMRLARAYVLIQKYNSIYSPEVGLMRGTIFPELYFPYHNRGGK